MRIRIRPLIVLNPCSGPNCCSWCRKGKLSRAKYEQQDSKGEWKKLCPRCAYRRLQNPWCFAMIRPVTDAAATAPSIAPVQGSEGEH